MAAVEEAGFEEVHFNEGGGAVQEGGGKAGAFHVQAALFGPGGAVQVLFLQELVEGGVGVVQAVAAEFSGAAVCGQEDFFVDEVVAVSGVGGGVEADDPVGIPAAVADEFAEGVAQAVEGEGGLAVGGGGGDGGLDAAAQFGG